MTSSIDGLRPMTAFDRIWPYDGVAFIDLLDDLALDGAEARHAVTPAAVRLTRSFRRFAYETGEPASDLRELLRVASSVPLESSWSRRLVCSLLDAAMAIPGCSAHALAQIATIKSKHLDDTTASLKASDWRVVRTAAMAPPVAKSGSSADDVFATNAALDVAATLAWPLGQAVKAVGEALPILCFAQGAASIRTSVIDFIGQYEYWDVQTIAVEIAGEARGARTGLPLWPESVIRDRHPDLAGWHEARGALIWASTCVAGQQVLSAIVHS